MKDLSVRLRDVGMEAGNLALGDIGATKIRRILAGESLREESRLAAVPLINFARGAENIVRVDIAAEPENGIDERVRVASINLAEIPEPGVIASRVRFGIFADFMLTGAEPVQDFEPSTPSLTEIIRRPLRFDAQMQHEVWLGQSEEDEGERMEFPLCHRLEFADVQYTYDIQANALLVTLAQYVDALMYTDPETIRLFNLSVVGQLN